MEEDKMIEAMLKPLEYSPAFGKTLSNVLANNSEIIYTRYGFKFNRLQRVEEDISFVHSDNYIHIFLRRFIANYSHHITLQ